MTGLKPDGRPECTGSSPLRAAFGMDGVPEHSGPVLTFVWGSSAPVLTSFSSDRCTNDGLR
jgi:hypothetical protein